MKSNKKVDSTQNESNIIPLNNILYNIRSKYILDKIITILPKYKSLDIIKYNKKLQKNLDLDIKDFKECMELYSTIKIELTPEKGKYGVFINLQKEEYYHIYFDDNKTEIKRNKLFEGEKVRKIKIRIDYQIKSFYRLFYRCNCIESIKFIKFDRNNITDMSYMFYACESLKEIDLTNFNTDNVNTMRSMFNVCTSLKGINVSKFNTNKVNDMSFMFRECTSLKELDISNFSVDNVTDMSYMFYLCKSLESLKLPNRYGFKKVNVHAMFFQCSFELKEKVKDNYTIYNYIKDEAFDQKK